jgi:hypothetical protein
MASPFDLFSALRTFSRTVIADPDGLKTTIATNVANQNYSGVALNGAEAALLLAGSGPARTLSVTTTASAATYRTGASFPIVVTGVYKGAVVTENLLLTQANGNETIIGAQVFDKVTSIAVPGQVDALGAFTFGVQDICGLAGEPFRGVKAHANGTLELEYQGALLDSLPVVAHAVESCLPVKILRTTAVAITAYF